MLIDWFTIGAQVLNFLILVWLLKRFLYKPIVHAIDAREKRVALALADADAKKAEAKKERSELQRKNEAFDHQRAALLTQATAEAKAERLRLLEEARQAAEALRSEQQEALEREQQRLNEEITRRTQEEVFAIARKALTDLAGTTLEERIIEMFVHRLQALSDEAKDGLTKALKTSSDPVRVRSAFELPSQQRAAIQIALNETFSADLHVRFETAPNVIGGIELTANGRKVAWSIAHYLASMEKRVGEVLKEQSKPVARDERPPKSGGNRAAPEAAK